MSAAVAVGVAVVVEAMVGVVVPSGSASPSPANVDNNISAVAKLCCRRSSMSLLGLRSPCFLEPRGLLTLLRVWLGLSSTASTRVCLNVSYRGMQLVHIVNEHVRVKCLQVKEVRRPWNLAAAVGVAILCCTGCGGSPAYV